MKAHAHLTNVEEVQETKVVVDTADKLVLTREFSAMSLSLSFGSIALLVTKDGAYTAWQTIEASWMLKSGNPV
jgi:hypothetical protein